ncbi:MAG: class I SAM-dependent methyltransferase [Acetobacteraceae bacterium]
MARNTNLRRYERIAALYDLLEWPFERYRYRMIRPQLFAGFSGRILDAGVGTGRNIAFYPPEAEIVGIDISPAMLARAERRKHGTTAAVELCLMDITNLRFADAAFDGAVASFVFCVLPDELQLPALRELRRVVKPGRPIRLLDYVRPESTVRRLVSRLWDPWISWAYGASFDHRTVEYIGAAGLQVKESRFVVNDLIRLLELRAAQDPGPKS